MPLPDRDAGERRRVVSVWQDSWLETPLTFIRDQVGSLSRWQARKVGFYHTPNPLLEPDFAPFPETASGKALRRLGGMRLLRDRYRHALAGDDIDVIHAHFASGGMNVCDLVHDTDKPIIVSFHGQDVTSAPYQPGFAGVSYLRRLGNLFDRASRLIAVSEFIADQLCALGAPTEKIIVHHIGIDVTEAVAAPVEDRHRSGIVFVGRLAPKKGGSDLLTAVSRLPGPLRSTPVTIVGYGALESTLTQLARELGVMATFVGRQDSTEVGRALASAALFCGPSRAAPDGDAEGFGMVFLEAALRGCPVVAYRHGGVVEAVLDGETGLLADEGDVDGLSRNLAELLVNRGRAEAYGESGRRRVLQLFDVRSKTAQLETIYDSVLEDCAFAESRAR